MQLRTVLTILFAAGLLALVALLPRTTLVLGWLWQNAERLAAEQGYTLQAEQLTGNAWGGVNIEGLRLSGPGLQLSSDSSRVEYGLISLLRGRLSVGAELSGLEGHIDPAALPVSSGSASAAGSGLPIDLHRLALEDVNLTIAEYDLYLPDVSVAELNVSSSERDLLLAARLSTPHGQAQLDGRWLAQQARLELDIVSADVRIARYWWPGAVAGTLTGELRADASGVELDAFISDAAIDYLELMVTDISGPVTMRELVIEGELSGSGLDGPVRADINVDIPQLHYHGVLTGNPRLEAAVPWLGRSLAVDLTGIQAEGPMSLRTVVTGWYDTQVTGTASGSGSLLGLPLQALLGEFGYSSALGVSVAVDALLAQGDVNVQIQPGSTQPRQLLLNAQQLQLVSTPATQLQLGGQLLVNLDERPDYEAQLSSGEFRLSGQLAGADTDLVLQGAGQALTDWRVNLSGSVLEQPVVSGTALLDFATGRAAANVLLDGLQLPGLAWPLSAAVSAADASLEFPLPLTVSATGGPLSLGPLPLSLDPLEVFKLHSADGSLSVQVTDTATEVTLDTPPLTLTGLPGGSLPLQLQGSVSLAGTDSAAELSARLAELELTVTDYSQDRLSGELKDDDDTLTYSFNTGTLNWQLQGDVPVAAAAELLELPVAGELSGSLSGQGLAAAAGMLSGELTAWGQPVGLQLNADQGQLLVQAAARLLGADWRLSGELLPNQELVADSQLGSIRLNGDQLSGAGELRLPAGLDYQQDGWQQQLDWRLDGSLTAASARLSSAGSNLSVSWRDGLTLSGTMSEQLRLYGVPVRLQAALAETGQLSGTLSHESAQLQLSGQLADGSINLVGELPAALLLEQLNGQLSVAGQLSWLEQPELNAELYWHELNAQLDWQPGAPAQLQASAPGLQLNLSADQLNAQLSGFDPGPYLQLPTEDLALTGELSGSLAQLQLELSGRNDWLSAQVSGTLANGNNALTVSADAWDGLLELTGELSGNLSEPGVNARLSSSRLDGGSLISVPPLELQLGLEPAGALSVTGPDAELRFTEGSWSGSLAVNLELFEQAHQLLIEPAGGTLLPLLTAQLSGPGLHGQLQLADGLSFELQLAETLEVMPALEQATLRGLLELDGSWSARLDAAATVPAAELNPLSLGAELTGDTAAFSGFGNIRAGNDAERLLSLTASSDFNSVLIGSDLASLDLEVLAAAFGIDASLTASGTAELTVGSEADWSLAGNLSGSAYGVPLELQLSGTPGSLHADGLVAGETVNVSAELSEQLALNGSWAGAQLQLQLLGSRLSGSLQAPAAAPTGAIDLSFSIVSEGSSSELELLEGSIGPASVTLAGPLLPAVELSGDARLAQLPDTLPLWVRSGPDGLQAGSSYGGLQLTASLSGAGLQLNLDSPAGPVALGWHSANGFTGSASSDLTLGAFGVQLRAEAAAGGQLQLDGQLRPAGSAQRLAELTATLGPQPLQAGSLNGRLNGTLNLSSLVPGLSERSLSLSSSNRLSGSLDSPRLEGSVLLLGGTPAEGRLSADSSGVELQLNGAGIAVNAASDWRSWQAQLELSQLPLERLSSLFKGASLDLRASGSGDYTLAGSQLELSSFAATTAQSRVSGSGSLAAGVLNGQLDVLLALADLDVGLELSGGASGQLLLEDQALTSPGSGRLSGGLELQAAGVAGSFGLDGTLGVSGSVAEPHISAALAGAGDDVLELDWQPLQAQFRLVSRLDAGPLSTDLTLASSPGSGLNASGTVSLPGGFFTVSSSPAGELQLLGFDAWRDWQLTLDPAATQLSVQGDLAGVRSELAGRVNLNATLADGQLDVSGNLTDLQLLGSSLGTVPVSSALSGPGLQLSGERLAGRLLLTGDWQLSRLLLDLTDDLNLVASGSGDLSSGMLDASVAGRLLERPVLGTAAAQVSPAGISLTALFGLLDGSASLDASFRQGNWQGSVTLSELLYSGVSLSGQGSISGALSDPRLELSTSADLLGLSGRGQLQLGRNLFSLQHAFSDPGLGGNLQLQASLHPEPELLLSGPDGNTFRLQQAVGDDPLPVTRRQLHASGQLNITGHAAELSLSAAPDGSSAEVFLGLSLLPGLAVDGSLALGSVEDLLAQVETGVQLGGLEQTFGELSLNLLAGELLLDEFGFRHPLGSVQASGSISLSGNSRISGFISADEGPLADLPALTGKLTIPFALIRGADLFRLVSNSRLGDLEATFDTATGAGTLEALLRSGGGTAEARLSWNQLSGVTGHASADGFVLFELAGGPPGSIDAALQFSGGRATGYAELRVGQGQLTANGHWGLADLLPGALATQGEHGGEFDIRIGAFELSELPLLARWAPALRGGLTAVVQVRDDVVAGNLLARGLQAAGAPLPVEAFISGTMADVRIAGSVAGSPLSLNLADARLSGLLEMRRFPLHSFAAAVAGPLDVLAEVTGVARFSLPLNRLGDSEFRVATEQVRLERSGIVTTGNVSMELSSGEFRVSEASFSGAGAWEASGVLRADLLDFSLEAEDADFGPMLGLIPLLSQLQAEAEGSLSLSASGSLAEPMISLVSEQLEFRLAGVSYRLADLLLQLQQTELTLQAELLATDPIQGALSLSGASGISLSPLAFQDARFSFAGSLVLPFIGQLEAIRGSIHSADLTPGAPLLTEVEASLGSPLRISGSLAPLNLDVRGQNLLLDLPSILLTGSRLDADLNLANPADLQLSGSIVLHESTLALNQAGSGPGLGSEGVAARLRFNDLQIEAPARLRLAESFGSAELGGSLTVSGTLAEPLLSGRADALRGTFQFAGRDFELQEASALFDVTRGLYPELRLTAVTTFDRNRLLPAGSRLQVIAPTDGSAQVTLSFAGTLEPDPETGIRLNLDPLLSSNVIVQDPRSDGLPAGPRPLSDDELLALITLGRAELGGIAGDAGLAPLVAQGALETAVDMLLLSELQRALGQALGLDLVEIRSSALTNLLSGNGADQQFGISVRFGGYVSDKVFATYRVSAFDDPEGLYAFSNEVGIRYALGPVVLDLAGSLNVPDTTTLSAVAQLSLGVLYEINPRTTLEAAFDLSGDEQQFRFGVTWRW